MIAIDSSSLIAFLQGDAGTDVEAVDESLSRGDAVLPPVVLTELLSDPKLESRVARWIRALPRLSIDEGYWARAALLRAKVLSKRKRARLADTLIAQSCIDHRVALVTRDADFRNFSGVSALVLATREQ
jgi:predicted nucleic acid-binding protein